jgi:hypothetical protein
MRVHLGMVEVWGETKNTPKQMLKGVNWKGIGRTTPYCLQRDYNISLSLTLYLRQRTYLPQLILHCMCDWLVSESLGYSTLKHHCIDVYMLTHYPSGSEDARHTHHMYLLRRRIVLRRISGIRRRYHGDQE